MYRVARLPSVRGRVLRLLNARQLEVYPVGCLFFADPISSQVQQENLPELTTIEAVGLLFLTTAGKESAAADAAARLLISASKISGTSLRSR